jgi:Na+/melibiose symporter-like transporter
MANQTIKSQVTTLINNVKYYWKEPPKGRYMSFKEIASYSFGGIGAYFIIQLGSTLIVGTTNMIVGGAIGVGPTDMYIIYLIATFLNIPLTAIRANMVDNTRGKAGKYRPYILSMGIPTALIALAYVWFPYEKLDLLFPNQIFGKSGGYVATCAVVFVFDLLLHFFFYFFQDAYTNLIHVLSPNTQERTDVLAIKSVVYSLAPSIMNMVLPIVAQYFTNDNLYDIKVYRISYPVFAVIGIGLTIIVYANTQEKIVQAKTHTIQIGFIDSLKEVAKNKYFWIIALAGWLGFLEGTYGSILTWSYNYGHTCNGTQMTLINLLTGNASLWGMLLAPFCIRKFGKKKVLVGVNFLNIVCILAMLIDMRNIWWLFVCVYFNWLVGAFEQITSPAIQADIRDYQQYRTGERIDGMFATVSTIGNIVTLATSAVLPAVEKYYGIYEGNGYAQPFDILDVKTGQSGLLYTLLPVLIIMAGVGAFLNMVPYFFYDFDEKKQKSVIRVLQVRSMFEDYANGALNNHQIVEAIDTVENARKMAGEQPKKVDKDMYKVSYTKPKKPSYQGLSKEEKKAAKKQFNVQKKSLKKQFKTDKKLAKKQFRELLEFNEEIEISKFVCKELDKFDSDLFKHQVEVYSGIYYQGLDSIKYINLDEAKEKLAAAKALPKNNEDEKELRKFEIEFAKKTIAAKKAFDKYYGSINEFVEPDMSKLTVLFNEEDECDSKIFELVELRTLAKKEKDKEKVNELKSQIKSIQKQKKVVQKDAKLIMDEFAKFNRAARPFNDAKKLLAQQENFSHFDEIAALYDEAKLAAEEEDRIKEQQAQEKLALEQEELELRKAQKLAKKKK